ncbi:Cna B-type domain-containing protein [Bifidobacterium pullorum subsp. saeculare]|uniref:Cna B-type domain-containing protein n=1 Tax=Bifidobacterium pullorum TaxID=78448 RepID=UPI00195AD629|nr:Cna B-type domain-containing protein [Bifidobacterium pullorum]MBM6705683.1 Cna B-type domain-containing protein [Bifidobacterium pullorum subsp. saeculare]
MRRPLRTAIAVIVATAMLTPTIASAAPVVPDAPSPVPGVESSSPYEDTVPDEDTAPQGDAGRGAGDVEPPQDETTSDSADTPHVDEAEQDTANENASDGESADADSTAEEDAAQIDGAEVLSDGGDGSGKVLLADADAVDGRDYVGQTVKEINETKYILIGNEQQLRAIGSGKRVIGGEVFSVKQTYDLFHGWKDDSEPTLFYPGDSDLDAETELRDEDVPEANGVAIDQRYKYYTYDENGNKTSASEDPDVNTGLFYTADADYIIFRDINLNTQVAGEPEDELWTPLMFSGRMFGADGSGQARGYLGNLLASLQDESTSVDVSMVTAPTISNVTVNQTGKMDSRAHSGIGFFGTVSSNVDTSDIGHSAGTAVVSNINLDHVSVTNASTETKSTDTLISGLTDVLSDLLGGVLSGLSGALSWLLKFLEGLLGGVPGLGDPLAGILDGLNGVTVGALGGLGNVLKGILDLRKDDPTTFATGAFAGRIVGDVDVNHCTVKNAEVENASAPGGADSAYVGMTGGFVGYMEGQAKYDGLSQILGNATDGLHALLNIIPGVGLGDLLELLSDQGNVAGLDKLVPVGYYNPIIDGCELTLSDNSIGTSDTTYAGGFVGLQIGSIIRNSSVSDTPALTVSAGEYAGGFAGLMRDAELEGLLQNLGVDLNLGTAKGLNPQSLTEGSSVSAPTLTVTAANHAGGFAGAMAASYAVNSSVATDTKLNVSATESYAGGFAGQMTMGWATNLGVDGDDDNLLSTLSNTVKSILDSSDSNKGQLLTLAGFEPSAALGCGVSGGSVTVGAKVSYAGGFTGAGEGAVIAQSDAEHVSALTHWQNGGVLAGTTVEERPVTVSGLQSVSAKSLAGGIAGDMRTAAVGGLLNNTVGIGSIGSIGSLKGLAGDGFTAFEVSGATVTGVDGGFAVNVTDYNAGGAIGLATGGKVSNVKVDNLQSVTGTGEVGGFIGQAAAGSTLGADGINLLGLVKLSGLLTVAQTTHLDVSGSSVNGVTDGFTVTANGKDNAAETDQFTAGGFYGRASSMTTTDSHVTNLKSVTAPNTNGMAGGFVGLSTTGGLAQIASDKDESSGILKQLIDGGLLSVDNLVDAVPYMVPKYKVTYVAYVDGGSVTADIAGGYAGSFESGEVNKFAEDEVELASKVEASPWAVKNISAVDGQSCAGGFGGRVVSGSLAEAGGGLDLLGGFASVNIDQLLSLVPAYMPVIDRAGVSADADPDTASASTTDGFTVSATKDREGIAGGYIGYGSGVQVSASDVKYLKHTTVKEPKKLEDRNADSYFDPNKSMYAVTGTQYAGGYIGEMNIGSTASAGKSLSLLGEGIQLNDVLQVLDAVASTIEDSDVEGQAGGYAVLASDTSNTEDPLGDAGGFAGVVRGSRIENSDAHNFSHIIGQVSAGGYAGQVVPGDVASVLGDDNSILNGLVKTDNSLASLLQHFVPEILNSETTSIPCGGAVRAQAPSDAKTLRGLAGGYIGHNVGGQIKGNVTGDGHSPKEAAAIRIRSVYGAEYAGGFTGLMEAGSTASTGSLGLLWGLVNVDNLLNALKVAYPTEESTAVYGPLRGLTPDEWNAWVDAVGANGGYGAELADNKGKVNTQEELAQKLADVAYGMNVVAGRKTAAETGKANVNPGGAAGGYVGAMVAGTITNGHAHDVKLVRGMRAAGGFAGMAEAGGAAELGSVSLFGESLNLNIDSLVGVANVFVPVIKSSSVEGYRTGMTVASPGLGSHDKDTKNDTGNAGGYIGLGSGVQIWGDGTDGTATPSCTASGLRRVRGAAYAGGFAGRLTAGTVVRAGTDDVSSGFLQQVIDTVLKGTGTQNLAQVLNATMSTVRGASVSPADEAWGFTVEGPASGDVEHPIAAGGFAGAIEATVLGDREQDDGGKAALTVTGLRGVDGGLYAGGFVGVATAGGVAQVNAGTGEGASTTILGGLLKLGKIDAVQAFQPFIYGGSVTGVADGLQVRANEWDKGGLMHSQRMSGNAGGFAGTVMSGEVQNSKVGNLNSVTGINYAGGFVGYTGKSGIADVEDLEALQLIGLTASVGDLIGTTVTGCSVAGIPAGYTVASQGPAVENSVNGDEPGKAEGGQKAGGFIGYADLAHITGGTATNLKRVGSAEAAGGFAGETSHAYLVSAAVDSAVLGALNTVVNELVKELYLPELERKNVIHVDLGGALSLDVLSEGDVLSVTLLGLKISASLSKGTGDGGTDVVNVTIGDSTFTLPCDKDGLTEDADLKVNLIKGNSAHITDSTVTGIADGYDVFGGGATQDKNGAGDAGYAGGFVGHNDEGELTGDKMVYADVVRGTAGKTGPFTGVTDYRSNWWFNDVEKIEHDNTYHVYRDVDLVGASVSGAQNMTVSPGASDTGVPGSDDPGSNDLATADNAAWARFDVTNHKPVAGASNLGDWQGAKANGADLGVYREDGAKAVLMADTAVTDNTGGLTPEPGDGQDPCAQKVDVTIQKVWNDGHNADGKRPDSITVQLTATYTDGNPSGTPIEKPITVELSSTDDQSAWGDTWRKVVEDLPVAITDDSGVHYLTYTPTEVTVGKGEDAVKLGESGYTVSYTVDAHDRVITITNSTPLPETGGMGAHWFALLGILLVGVGILLTRKDAYGRGTGRHRAAR